MSLLPYLQFVPVLGERIFVAEGARVIGRATLGDHVSIWFNTVVRADVNTITIGKNTNVQDMCMFHVTEINSVTVGENTSFGHSVTLHGCKIGNGCLIGMGAIILDGAEIGDNCLVAAGSLVTPGKKFPAGSMIKGRPAVVDRPLTPEEIHRVSHHYEAYINYKEQYLGMEDAEKKKGLRHDLKAFLRRIDHHNLFLLSSSISYYAALSLAPLLLIVLSIASLIGDDMRQQLLSQISMIAPELRGTLEMVFQNLKEQVDLGSISGLVGLGFLIFFSSYLFVQLRYSLDLIYGDIDVHRPKSVFEMLKARGMLMLVVMMMCGLFVASLLINPIFDYLFASRFANENYIKIVQFFLTFSVLFILFTGLYKVTPTKKKKFKSCAQMSLLTSGFFIVGNILTGAYMKNFAMDSLYGAAGALLIFLLWTFYSSLSLFVSVEVFEFLKRRKT